MITKKNLKEVLLSIGFNGNKDETLEKEYKDISCSIIVDFKNQKIKYPEDKGFKVNVATTCNFFEPENFVVLECVNRLFEKGYRPEHIELERAWTLGHEQKSGRADICVTDNKGCMLFIVECKTFGSEYQKEMKNILTDGGQLISYWQQEGGCQWLVLYASNYNDEKIEYTTESIDCSDDENILLAAKKDTTILLYQKAHTVEELYTAWKETYEQRFCGDVIFRDDSVAYNIGVKPLRKKDLKDFTENNKIVNRFEEILRHNNVSDKENAFNRLIALFICKLVDEIQKAEDDIVEFQYKVGTDTYESLQDRLQRLHKEGMEKFMREEIFYVSDDYAENLVKQYTNQNRIKMIDELKKTLRILKFYTNNDFAFKDVHNEELFYQNGKILVEVVQLFQGFRIIGSADVQMLGDLFEQLLNKGFKQNEGQFFTPTPITRFIWDSLPIKAIMTKADGVEYPKVIDYACGAGHFLTEGYEAIEAVLTSIGKPSDTNHWVENKIYGIEKDYRLARVSKISLFMHGAGNGNIIFGDGLENYRDKSIIPNTFDILVANPPYSVKAFKPHLKLTDNKLDILAKISNDGSEIETLFVERISQLLKPEAVAAVVLPSGILNKENESFVSAREILLKNFHIRAIAMLGSTTFSKTGTNTVILFLQKFNEPPKRIDLVSDSVTAILNSEKLEGWEDEAIFRGYLKKIGVKKDEYHNFIQKSNDYSHWACIEYFGQYYTGFVNSAEYNKKIKQKSFNKLSDKEKTSWLNQHFYDYALSIEQEKLFYYSLIYNQETLIVSAPDKNKEQKKFLGYKWSDRKGQEGIKIIKAGGCLYNDKERTDNNTIAGLIRNTFDDLDSFEVTDLENYYYRLRLQDMIDFSGISFNKSIKTTPTRVLKDIPGLTNYRLSDKSVFDLSIGNRVVSDEVVENGSIPIYSANVFEEFGRTDKQNITDFSMPSILWGIDGDWMVNIIPENQPFYPTDHCGVLRIKTKDIVPKYMAETLQVEGEFEGFSRSNRASTQRISNLIIQIPSATEQQRIVDEIEAIDNKISNEQAIISEQSEKVKSKFKEMFGDLQQNDKGWEFKPLQKICDVRDGTHDSPKYIECSEYRLLTSQNFTKGYVDFSNSNFISEQDYNKINKRSLVEKNDIIMPMIGTIGSPVIIDTDMEFAIKNVALIKFANSDYLPLFIKYVLDSDYFQWIVSANDRGSNRKFISLDDLRNLEIPIVSLELQNKFADYAIFCDKLIFEAEKRLDSLKNTRESLVDIYFR